MILPSLGSKDTAHQRPFNQWVRLRFSPHEDRPGGGSSERAVFITQGPS